MMPMAFEIPLGTTQAESGDSRGVGKSLLHPLKKHIWKDEDDHEDEDIESFVPINETR